MENINLILTEIYLFSGICILLMLGVYIKKSFHKIYNLSIVLLIAIIFVIYKNGANNQGVFLDSFISDPLSNYIKILIAIATIIILITSKQFIFDNKISKFESINYEI